MKKKIKDAIAYIGFMVFLIGASSAESESLLIPTILTFSGLITFYIATDGGKCYEEDEPDD